LKSRSEINVNTLAAAIAATINSPCNQDRDSFGTNFSDRYYVKRKTRANLPCGDEKPIEERISADAMRNFESIRDARCISQETTNY
jgi:hypothetical protein